jgi:hypothetical protein
LLNTLRSIRGEGWSAIPTCWAYPFLLDHKTPIHPIAIDLNGYRMSKASSFELSRAYLRLTIRVVKARGLLPKSFDSD